MPRSIKKLNQWKAKIQNYIASQDVPPSLWVLHFLLEEYVKKDDNVTESEVAMHATTFSPPSRDHTDIAQSLLKKMETDTFDLMAELDVALQGELKEGNELELLLMAYFYYYKDKFTGYKVDEHGQETDIRYENVVNKIFKPLHSYVEQTKFRVEDDQQEKVQDNAMVDLLIGQISNPSIKKNEIIDNFKLLLTLDISEEQHAKIKGLAVYLQGYGSEEKIILLYCLLLIKINLIDEYKNIMVDYLKFMVETLYTDHEFETYSKLLIIKFFLAYFRVDSSVRDLCLSGLLQLYLDENNQVRNEAWKALRELGWENSVVIERVKVDLTNLSLEVNNPVYKAICEFLSETGVQISFDYKIINKLLADLDRVDSLTYPSLVRILLHADIDESKKSRVMEHWLQKMKNTASEYPGEFIVTAEALKEGINISEDMRAILKVKLIELINITNSYNLVSLLDSLLVVGIDDITEYLHVMDSFLSRAASPDSPEPELTQGTLLCCFFKGTKSNEIREKCLEQIIKILSTCKDDAAAFCIAQYLYTELPLRHVEIDWLIKNLLPIVAASPERFGSEGLKALISLDEQRNDNADSSIALRAQLEKIYTPAVLNEIADKDSAIKMLKSLEATCIGKMQLEKQMPPEISRAFFSRHPD